ncbi:uncharacterized protein LOC135206296 [Macrobrachium nipponense]|uniref:uncharacterized protein LOC135206296 n=1 Tax=Macrobrachium nipponense TaxID=159736 RepID=UPI0030C8C847
MVLKCTSMLKQGSHFYILGRERSAPQCYLTGSAWFSEKKKKAGEGKAAASKKILTEQEAEAMESETSQATTTATTSTVNSNTVTDTATTTQTGSAADEDSNDQSKEALTQDQPDNEELLPGDDQSEEGRAAAGAEDSDSQPPHLERDYEQRQPQKKSLRKALLLDNDTQEQLIEWIREHELLWRKGATEYKDTKKKTELWVTKARELDNEGGAEALRTWWRSVRDLYAKLLSKKSGQAAAKLTDRELFIHRTCAFLHKEVKPRKASQTSDFSSQPAAVQPSAPASTSRQPSNDVEEEDEGSLSLIETQAAVTRSLGSTPPAPSSTTTRPRRAATRAEPEDSPAMLEKMDCMKATNSLIERLVQAQEISHARQPFITYMSQSLQRLPEAQYQLAVERMTCIM